MFKQSYIFFSILQNFIIFIIVMTKKERKEVKLDLRLTNSLREQYKQYCIENDLDMSKHIREFIKKTVSKEK